MKRRGKFRTKFKRAGKSIYSIRNPDGTFANIESIDRAMRAEMRKRAKKIVKEQYGFRGETRARKRK